MITFCSSEKPTLTRSLLFPWFDARGSLWCLVQAAAAFARILHNEIPSSFFWSLLLVAEIQAYLLRGAAVASQLAFGSLQSLVRSRNVSYTAL